MSNKSLLWLCSVALLAFFSGAHANVFCSASSAGFSTLYNSSTLNTIVASFTVTCSRDNAGGPPNSTVSYQISANNGLNPSGTQNRAASLGNFINYEVATNSSCTLPWDTTTPLPIPSASFAMSKNSTTSHSYTFYGCIPAGQAPPLGAYIDTVTMTLFPGTGKATGDQFSFAPGSFPVTIVMPTTCVVSTPPATVSFAYTAFSASNVLANSSFGVTCSAGLPYTMTLDATVDVVAGLNYSLALNTTGSGGTNPLNSVGTGSAQTFFINGTMAAGQAGACTGATCIQSNVRTLMISY